MPPIFSVVSKYSNTGKTTVICKLVEKLKAKGYNVATIKHDHGNFQVDRPGKDTWKHTQAGSEVTVISSPSKLAIMEKVEAEYNLDEIIEKIPQSIDIVITEGFKNEEKPKIEIFRREISHELLEDRNDIFAIITDEPLNQNALQFAFDEMDALADIVEDMFLKKNIYKSKCACY